MKAYLTLLLVVAVVCGCARRLTLSTDSAVARTQVLHRVALGTRHSTAERIMERAGFDCAPWGTLPVDVPEEPKDAILCIKEDGTYRWEVVLWLAKDERVVDAQVTMRKKEQ